MIHHPTLYAFAYWGAVIALGVFALSILALAILPHLRDEEG